MTFYVTGLQPLHKQKKTPLKNSSGFHHQIYHTKDEEQAGNTHPNCLK